MAKITLEVDGESTTIEIQDSVLRIVCSSLEVGLEGAEGTDREFSEAHLVRCLFYRA